MMADNCSMLRQSTSCRPGADKQRRFTPCCTGLASRMITLECKIVVHRRTIVILRKHLPSRNKTEHSPAAVDTLWRCNRCHSLADSGGCTSSRNPALVAAINILQLVRRILSSIDACSYRLLHLSCSLCARKKLACALLAGGDDNYDDTTRHGNT